MPKNRQEFDLSRLRELADRVQSQIGTGLKACNGDWRSLTAPRGRFYRNRDQILATAGALGEYVFASDWSTIPGRLKPPMDDPVDDLIGIELHRIVRSCGQARRLLRRSVPIGGSADLQSVWITLDRCLWSIGQLCGEQPDAPTWMMEFWWKGERHDVPPKPYKLLLMLWTANGNRCRVCEVTYRIWGTGKSANALKQVIKQLNCFFESVGCHYAVSRKSDYIELLR